MSPFDVPQPVVDLLRILHRHGYEAVIVGGSVRDALCGRPVRDWDLATSADAASLLRALPRAVPIGGSHGTVMVPTAVGPVDVSPYRAADLAGDLAHRDFTIDAIAWHPERGFVDPTEGRADLAASRLRTPGRPEDRLGEDPLRALRAARLVAAFGVVPDAALEQTLPRSAEALARVAAERVRAELDRLLEAPHRGDGVRLLRRTGLEAVLVPEAQADCADLLDALPAGRDLGLAAWLRGTRAPRILGRWRFPHARARQVERVVRLHPVDAAFHTDAGARRLRTRAKDEATLRDALTLCRAQRRLAGDDLARLEALEAALDRTRGHAITVAALALTGRDVIEVLGVPPGPEVGRALRALLERVIEDPSLNEPQKLRALLREGPQTGPRGVG